MKRVLPQPRRSENKTQRRRGAETLSKSILHCASAPLRLCVDIFIPHGDRRDPESCSETALWFGILIFALVPLAVLASADDQRRDHVTAGLKAFDEAVGAGPQEAEKLYEKARDEFEAAIATGLRNGKLYYDLGNAYRKLDQIGKAIVNYRRALALAPGDSRVLANLQAARRLRTNIIEEGSDQRALLQRLFFWHYDTRTKTRAFVAETVFIAGWVMLVVYLLRRRRVWARWAVILILLSLVPTASVAVDWHNARHHAEGVLIEDGVMVRKGPGERDYELMFAEPLNQGVECTILEAREGWLRILLPNNKDGWIKKESAEVI